MAFLPFFLDQPRRDIVDDWLQERLHGLLRRRAWVAGADEEIRTDQDERNNRQGDDIHEVIGGDDIEESIWDHRDRGEEEEPAAEELVALEVIVLREERRHGRV